MGHAALEETSLSLSSYETLDDFQRTTGRHIPEDRTLEENRFYFVEWIYCHLNYSPWAPLCHVYL
jgi:hypothetical protein